jgi:hypothetical protein
MSVVRLTDRSGPYRGWGSIRQSSSSSRGDPMGWLFAFIFLATSVVLALFLYAQWDARARADAQVRALIDRAKGLEAAQDAAARLKQERDAVARTYIALRTRVEGLANVDEERERVEAEVKELRLERDSVASTLGWLRREHQQLTDEVTLAEAGFYETKHHHDTSASFAAALARNQDNQKEMIRRDAAATAPPPVPGLSKGDREQIEKLLALMVRAFNGECDSAVSKVRYNNFTQLKNRVEKTFTTINKLGAPQGCRLSDRFLALKIEELELTCEHAMKVQAEREQQREIKEQMRQDAIAAREVERATQQALAEEHRRQVEVEQARRDLEAAAAQEKSAEQQEELRRRVAELEERLAEATTEKDRALSRAQQTRAGHVYVISNLGSFGDNVYKIGMTRRLDPMDRIWELSDASVPFDFDVHAIISTDDAPGLEAELHARFANRRLNLVNERKEFFHVSIQEIVEVVRDRCGDILLTEVADADEFLQSEARRRSEGKPLLSQRQMVSQTLLAAT